MPRQAMALEILALALLSTVVPVMPAAAAAGGERAVAPLALRGLDPVALTEGKEVPGDPSLRARFGRFTYAFSSQASLERFRTDPERYSIQAGGRCLHMWQMDGDPDLFKVYQGKIYLAANRSCLAGLTGNLDDRVEELVRKRRAVAILLFPGVQIIDYTGPWEVLGEAGYEVFTVAATAEPLTTNMGMRVIPDYSFGASPRPDILVLPGGGVPRVLPPDDATLAWVRSESERAQITMSVCNGAFWLANAGLLDGKKATTTSNGNLEALRQQFPRVTVISDQRFVDAGKIITTAGLSSGIDGALHVVERLDGRGQAKSVALGLEYDWRPEGGFARGALADKYIFRLGEFSVPSGMEVKNGDQDGNRERWQRSWRIVDRSRNARTILALVDELVARTWKKTADRSVNGSARSTWAFQGDDGRPWRALTQVAPARQAPGQFDLTIQVERDRRP